MLLTHTRLQDLAKFQQKKAEDENKPLADDTFNGLPLRFLKRTLKLVETADLHALCACSPKTLLSVISCPVQLRVNPRRLLPVRMPTKLCTAFPLLPV